jgi:hypothetical protein
MRLNFSRHTHDDDDDDDDLELKSFFALSYGNKLLRLFFVFVFCFLCFFVQAPKHIISINWLHKQQKQPVIASVENETTNFTNPPDIYKTALWYL